MKKTTLCFGAAAALMITSAPAFAQGSGSVSVSTGKMLYDSAGKRVGTIYRVTPEGNPQLILNGRLITVPASTISDTGGKITTSLSKADLGRSQ